MPVTMAPSTACSISERTFFTRPRTSRMQRQQGSSSCRQPLLHSLLPLVLLLVVLTGPSPAGAAPLDAFNRYVALRETWVRWIAGNVTELYRDSCSALKTCGMSCSRLSCSNYFPNMQVSDGPSCSATSAFASTFNETACGKACKGGSPLSFEQPAVRLSPHTSYGDDAVQRDVCVLNQPLLGQTFQGLFNSDPQSTQWLYIGTATGVFSIFPSRALYKSTKSNDTVAAINTCAAYDPRLRPWYVAGASGPKDVVILMDVSRSLIDDPYVQSTAVKRLDVLRAAVKDMVLTVSAADFVSVIAVDGGAATLLASGPAPRLVKAIFDYPKLLSTAVAGLNASQNSLNITSGLELAFRTFQNSEAASSGCTRLLVVLSDGLDVYNNNSYIRGFVAQQQSILLQRDAVFSNAQGRVKILAYNLRTNSPSRKGSELLQALACENDGVYRDADTEDLPNTLSDWYTYAAATNSPAWTQSYGSTSGGNVTTCTLAVYDSDGSLIGVVGIDVDIGVLEALLEDPRDLDSALGALYTESSQQQCPIGSTSDVTKTLQCALERRRGTNCSAYAIAAAPAPGPSGTAIPTPPPPQQCPGIVPVQKCVAPSWTAEQLFCPIGPHVDFTELVCCPSCTTSNSSATAPPSPRSIMPPSPPVTTTPPPTLPGANANGERKGKGGGNTGAVAGVAIGGVVVVAAVALVAVWIARRKKAAPKNLDDHVIATSDHPGQFS